MYLFLILLALLSTSFVKSDSSVQTAAKLARQVLKDEGKKRK
jgi:hypothetical protein